MRKRCSTCRVEKDFSEFYADRSKKGGVGGQCKACQCERSKRNYHADKERAKAYMQEYSQRPEVVAKRKERYAALTQVAIDAYGGVCACCGEARREFLNIDHVNSDGARHREEDSSAGNIYFWLAKNGYPQDGRFQVLCWNCNCAKGVRGGCPHLNEPPRVRHVASSWN